MHIYTHECRERGGKKEREESRLLEQATKVSSLRERERDSERVAREEGSFLWGCCGRGGEERTKRRAATKSCGGSWRRGATEASCSSNQETRGNTNSQYQFFIREFCKVKIFY
jgi:hypothetical protein